MCVWREAKSHNIIGDTVLYEIGRNMAVIAIKDQDTVLRKLLGRSIVVKVLNPLHRDLIIGPTVIRGSNNGFWINRAAVGNPRLLNVLSLKDNEG